jgi:predicted RNA polymerase sigma factor
MKNNSVAYEVERLYKAHFGKMVSTLLCFSQNIDLESAEDIVHDSFSAALIDWQINGIPLQRAGWIYKVCRNKAINKVNKDKRVDCLVENIESITTENEFVELIVDDYQLRLLFACAHPDLSPKIQAIITLKYVVNLRVEAISKIFAMTVDGVDKLLVRARLRIKEEKILLREPLPSAFRSRLSGVHKVLYLVFNEGHKSSWGNEIVRQELGEEALLATRSLMESSLGNKETEALYALMLFNSARFKSRIGATGELFDLENQDRTRWDRDLIALGCRILLKSQCENLSSYHLEASIACLHCTAAHFGETNWKAITQLYSHLLQRNKNPFVELNFAIALYYAGEIKRAFQLLNELLRHPILNRYYLLNLSLGKLYSLEGELNLSRDFLLKALGQTNMEQEKHFIRKMIANLRD